VEPFGGSLAVLLNRPDEHKWWNRVETVGDYSGLVVNFHRAVAADPDRVAYYASWPVTETDLTARHLKLVRENDRLTLQLMADPEHFDLKLAGWWLWGLSSWVGGEWCSGLGPWKPGDPNGPGVYRKIPMVHGSHGGKGVHKKIVDPNVEPGTVVDVARNQIQTSLRALSNRLRRVRVTCGDAERLLNGAVATTGKNVCGVFLDPPYDLTLRRANLYGPTDVSPSSSASDAKQVHERVRAWAILRGDNPTIRIAYCSYSTPFEDAIFLSAGWVSHSWTAAGGYGLQSNNQALENRGKEIVWFSPHCHPVKTVDSDNKGMKLF